MKNIVLVALGGNAFVRPNEPLTMMRQFQVAREALSHLIPLFATGAPVVLTHGNGPQVGHILVRVEEALGKAYAIPLEVCVAESEGELGYVLQQTLYNLLAEQAIQRPIVSLLTQVVVDADDPGFAAPTKPIGPFYTAEQAVDLVRKGFVVRDDAGRGLRRMVASPLPRAIVEAPIITRLIADGVVVIAAGGGGIPVIQRDGRLVGVEAVIDKDLASALLGEMLDARLLLILTGVPCAYQDFGTPRQAALGRITRRRAEELLAEGHFAPGSMGPKIEAAIRFAARPGATAIICDPPSVTAALQGKAGTVIQNEEFS